MLAENAPGDVEIAEPRRGIELVEAEAEQASHFNRRVRGSSPAGDSVTPMVGDIVAGGDAELGGGILAEEDAVGFPSGVRSASRLPLVIDSLRFVT